MQAFQVKEITDRLDKIIKLLEEANKPVVTGIDYDYCRCHPDIECRCGNRYKGKW